MGGGGGVIFSTEEKKKKYIAEQWMTHLRFLAAKLYVATSPGVPHIVGRLHTSSKKHAQPG